MQQWRCTSHFWMVKTLWAPKCRDEKQWHKLRMQCYYYGTQLINLQFLVQQAQALKRAVGYCVFHSSYPPRICGQTTLHSHSVLESCSVEHNMLAVYHTWCWYEKRWQSRRQTTACSRKALRSWQTHREPHTRTHKYVVRSTASEHVHKMITIVQENQLMKEGNWGLFITQ